MDKISEACKKEHGDNLVPRDYPEPYRTEWKEAYAKENWAASYPFYAENVKNFAEFCQESGGFEIC